MIGQQREQPFGRGRLPKQTTNESFTPGYGGSTIVYDRACILVTQKQLPIDKGQLVGGSVLRVNMIYRNI